MARAIAARAERPAILSPVLVGAFVFAADLARALSREGLDLPVEFLWLRSYGDGRQGGRMAVRSEPGEAVRGKSVSARRWRARSRPHAGHGAPASDRGRRHAPITTAVVVDKRAPGRSAQGRLSPASPASRDFIVGYGMDDAGSARGLPYIAKVGLIRTASAAGRYSRALPWSGRVRCRACAAPEEFRAPVRASICRAASHCCRPRLPRRPGCARMDPGWRPDLPGWPFFIRLCASLPAPLRSASSAFFCASPGAVEVALASSPCASPMSRPA